MIIKGKARAAPGELASHLSNVEKNEKVRLLETRGPVADDLHGALVEMDAYAAGTRCRRSLYHAAISPAPPHRLSDEQRTRAIDLLEEKLGLTGQARVVVMHEKEGREHIHVVWSRIDLEKMRAIPDSHNYRKHEEVSRQLEREFGHERVQGAHHERDGVERPARTPSRAELRQEERTGIKARVVRVEVTEIFRNSDGAIAFVAGLADSGYTVARGDRRDFVIIDRAGGIHSLARRIDGIRAHELRKFMSALEPDKVPTVEDAIRHTQADGQRDTGLPYWSHNAGEEDRYWSGDGYVTQSKAAMRDFKDRQKKLEKRHRERMEGRPNSFGSRDNGKDRDR